MLENPKREDRVRVSKAYPYGRCDSLGTVVKLPFPKSQPKDWVGVRFDDNPDYIAEWHVEYFDLVL